MIKRLGDRSSSPVIDDDLFADLDAIVSAAKSDASLGVESDDDEDGTVGGTGDDDPHALLESMLSG